MELHGNMFFYGGFLIGELLGAGKTKFNHKTSLLPLDIKFRDESMPVWIRSPKIHNGSLKSKGEQAPGPRASHEAIPP